MDLQGRLIFQVVSAKLPKHNGWPDPADGEIGGEIKNKLQMKNAILIIFLSLVTMFGTCTMMNASNVSPVGIGVSLSSKAYWDGPTQSCLPREKGFCLHIAINLMPVHGQIFGTIEQKEGKTLELTVSRNKGIDKETFYELFKAGKFIADGPITFSTDVLEKLKLPASYSIPAGEYPFSIEGDRITIYFK